MTGAGEPEALWVRERALRFLEGRSIRPVSEAFHRGDGWRGEFVTPERTPLHLHKPFGAPWVSLGTAIPARPGHFEARVLDLVAMSSDFECSIYHETEGASAPAVVVTYRLPVAALHREDFFYAVDNLLACRSALGAILAG